MQRNPFKHHRFPADLILCAVRWYCRYALSCRDVRDLLAERGIKVDTSTIHRWVRKFDPEIAKQSFKHRSWRGLNWHVDETYIRVGGKWRYLWRAVDQRGQMVVFASQHDGTSRLLGRFSNELVGMPGVSTAHNHNR